MNILIAYTSKYGSVFKAAQLLSDSLNENTDIINISNFPNTDISKYDTVILGGSIYMGKIQKNLSQFINSNRENLLEKNMGLFLCAGEQYPQKKEILFQNNFPEYILNKVLIKDILGHALYIDKINILEKILARLFKNTRESYEDFYIDKIENFANTIKSGVK